MGKKVSLISLEMEELLRAPDREEQLRDIFSGFHSRDIFILCEDLDPDENAIIVMALDYPQGVEFFQEFRTLQKLEIFKHFSKEWMAKVLEQMAPDERADFLKSLPEEQVDKILPLVAQAERNDIRKLLSYAEGTVGSVLTTEYASLPADITANEAIDRLKKQAFNRETIYYVYIVDCNRRLIGFVSLKDLLVAESSDVIQDIMFVNVISVHVDEDQAIAAQKLADYDLLAIPVVDAEERLVGIVTHDDVVDVLIEEYTEDIYRYGAVGEYIDYMNSRPFMIAKHRILWLLLLVVVGFVTGIIMEHYEIQMQAVVALVFFIPLLCGSGGNAGTQSSTVVIRGLATGEINMNDLFAVFRKELVIGSIVGLAMAILAGARAIILNKNPLLAVTVGLAMIATVIVATTLGAVLPIVFKKMKMDPALMSGPFISSIVDIVSLVIYFQIAVFMFR